MVEQISDIGLAAFLKVIKGINYSGMPTKANGKKFIFSFDIDKANLDKIRAEYLNSKYRSFDQEIRSLKKIVHG
jgi:hypothetical protein